MKYALIIGSMKSGTSAIFSILGQHPEICATKIKEPQYFNGKNYQPGRSEEYEKLWEFDPSKHQYALEASTSYTKMPSYPNVAERIKDSGIEARFIYIMRNPVDRIESQMRHSLAKKWETYDRQGRVVPHIISVSRYYYQIREYFLRFPANDILLLKFEEFASNPELTIRKICEFLKLDPDFQFRYDVMNIHDGLQYAYRVKPLPGLLKKILGKSKDYFKKIYFIYNFLNSLEFKLDKKIKNTSYLPEKELLRIKDILKDDIVQLNKEYDFDTSVWGL